MTLSLGLWPFYAPSNQVTWLGQVNGVVLERYASIVSSGVANHDPTLGCTIEIWVQPTRWTGATILSLYNPKIRSVFSLYQSLEDLEVTSGKRHFSVDNVFYRSLREKTPIFITVVSSPGGTAVFLDGRLVTDVPGFSIPEDALSRRIILGDAPLQPDSFRGKIFGLAIYDGAPNAGEVMRHFQTWTSAGRPEIRDEKCFALYLFNERLGKTIHNLAGAGPALTIPANYEVVDKIALEPIWSEFNFSSEYWHGNLKNVVGFLPVGFCFYALFVIATRISRPMLLTLLIGCAISVTIEVLQIFLPMRDSGTTDIVTNTLGTWLGVLLYRYTSPLFNHVLPSNPERKLRDRRLERV